MTYKSWCAIKPKQPANLEGQFKIEEDISILTWIYYQLYNGPKQRLSLSNTHSTQIHFIKKPCFFCQSFSNDETLKWFV